jgi:hypothetical protein
MIYCDSVLGENIMVRLAAGECLISLRQYLLPKLHFIELQHDGYMV